MEASGEDENFDILGLKAVFLFNDLLLDNAVSSTVLIAGYQALGFTVTPAMWKVLSRLVNAVETRELDHQGII